MMLFIRSLLFSILFTLESAVFVVLALPALAMPSGATIFFARMWSRTSLALLEYVCGIGLEIEGLENIPANRHVIFASKHQSMWETVAYQCLIGRAVFMFKKEILVFIPPFGLEMLRAGCIMVDRGRMTRAGLERLVERFRRALERAHVIVFPEGTRTRPGAPPQYKSGLAVIAAGLGDATIVPIAINSGRHWPKRGFLKRPGNIRMKILPAIEARGLSRGDIHARVECAIESAMAGL